jgi:hypothetical protein
MEQCSGKYIICILNAPQFLEILNILKIVIEEFPRILRAYFNLYFII